MTCVTIVTLNTWKGEGAYARRLEAMSTGLQALRPDIVLLQEALATVDGHVDTARHIANRIGLRLVFTPARRKSRRIEGKETDCFSGLALLSRYTGKLAQQISLPTDPGDGERLCQVCSIEHPELPLLVANTHLTHLEGRDDLRRRQLEAIVEKLAMRSRGRSVILGGDFNATPADPSLQWLTSQQALAFTDAWTEAGTGNCANTLNLGEPPRCIDHLLRSAGSAKARWIDVRTALGADSDQTVLASDHLAVVGTLELKTAAPRLGA